MSITAAKCMMCFNCSGYFSIKDENFPEDLYDLIIRHRLSQLIWICRTCFFTFGKKDLNPTLVEGQQKIHQKLNNLSENLCALTEEVRKLNCDPCSNLLMTAGFNTSNMNSFDDSISSDSGTRATVSRCSSTVSLSSTHSSISVNNSANLQYLNEILNTIKIPRDEEKTSKRILNDVLDMIIAGLKSDPEFKCLYNRNYFTGSSYNDLRITSASEYDINLVLQMPANTVDFQPEFFQNTFAYGKVKVKQLPNMASKVSDVEKFLSYCQENNYLLPQKVLSWLQRHIDNLLRQPLKLPQDILSIKSHQSGPARTIVISTRMNYSISVDLVPVFEFGFSALDGTPYTAPLLEISADTSKHSWFMVPKGCQGEYDLSILEVHYSWRLDFPNAEKLVLHDKLCAKPVIKLLKLLRDRQNWKNLASYYLKTVVLLEVIEHSSKEHWSNSKLFDRLLETLKRLENYLNGNTLPHFLTKSNLLLKMNKPNCINWKNFLNHMISTIESEPKTIFKFFTDNVSQLSSL